MNGAGSDGAQPPSLESVQQVRLLALLHDLVRRDGRSGAAAALGVHRKTVAAALNTGRLSQRMQVALRVLLMEGRAAGAPTGKPEAPCREWGQQLEAALRNHREELLAAINSQGQQLRDEAAQWAQTVEGRLAALESHRGERVGPATVCRAPRASRPVAAQVVTEDPAPAEGELYGAAAPLIVEWRQARDAHGGAADRLTAVRAEERMWEVELALIETHQLTLPPATAPWDQLTRRDEVHWRRRTLARVRGERRGAEWRRRLRRVLTLGWW